MKAEHSFEKEMPDSVLYDWLVDKKAAWEMLTSMKAEFKRAAVVFNTPASLSFIPGKTNSTINHSIKERLRDVKAGGYRLAFDIFFQSSTVKTMLQPVILISYNTNCSFFFLNVYQH